MTKIDERKEGQASERFLCFSLANEEYAVALLVVREVIALPPITSVPHTPEYFLGVMNLRGQIVSIVDLRTKFGLKAEHSENDCVIICQFQSVLLGVVVSSVNSVLNLLPAEIGQKPELVDSIGSDFVKGVVKKDRQLVLIVDLAAALSSVLVRIAQAA